MARIHLELDYDDSGHNYTPAEVAEWARWTLHIGPPGDLSAGSSLSIDDLAVDASALTLHDIHVSDDRPTAEPYLTGISVRAFRAYLLDHPDILEGLVDLPRPNYPIDSADTAEEWDGAVHAAGRRIRDLPAPVIQAAIDDAFRTYRDMYVHAVRETFITATQTLDGVSAPAGGS